ncbi:MAG TPA: Hpt domain-containing protein, partial [Polyangiales bacterium]
MSQRSSSQFSSGVEADAADVFRLIMEEHRHGLSAAKQLLARMRKQERVRDIEGLGKLERFFSLVKASSSYLGLTHLREIAFEAERVLDRLQWPSSVPTAAALLALEDSLRFVAAELSRDPRTPPTSEQREQASQLLSHLRSAEPGTRSVLPDQLSDEQLFVEDARRHLQQCRAALVQAADDTTQRAEAIHAAFRAMHTLKGNAGMMGFAELEALGRAAEWALEGLRSSE